MKQKISIYFKVSLAQHVRRFFLEAEQEGENEVLSCLLLAFRSALLVTYCVYVKSWSQTALGAHPLETRHHAMGLPTHSA